MEFVSLTTPWFQEAECDTEGLSYNYGSASYDNGHDRPENKTGCPGQADLVKFPNHAGSGCTERTLHESASATTIVSKTLVGQESLCYSGCDASFMITVRQ